MNKNKIIFIVVWIIFLLAIIYVFLFLTDKKTPKSDNLSTFKIWIVWDNIEWIQNIFENFKKVNNKYSNQGIEVNTFSSYDDYSYALTSSIINWNAPDIFVLNNNEKQSIFSNQVIWLDRSYISPNDFRKRFKWFFADDLIVTVSDWENKTEFLKWIPTWYETLWIYYNRRFVNNIDLKSISTLNNFISEIKKENSSYIPLWIWNWTTVIDSSDIITQFFLMSDWVNWLEDLTWNNLKKWLVSYMYYWDKEWYNWYNTKYDELLVNKQNSLDLFSKWDVFMVVWYPRMLKLIKEKWYSKNFLLATPFPYYNSWEWKTLVNYNYFVINKNSNNLELSNLFLSYLSTDLWQQDYLDNYKYYLPAILSLESEKLEEKVDEDYFIVLWDFFSDKLLYTSFDKWIKTLYDKEIIKVLDNEKLYENMFKDLRNNILCKKKKYTDFQNLSSDCDK